MSAKFFINEENLGTDANKAQAEYMIEKLVELGWPMSYGDSMMNKTTETEDVMFDKAFTAVLETPRTWLVLREDVFGYECVPMPERTE